MSAVGVDSCEGCPDDKRSRTVFALLMGFSSENGVAGDKLARRFFSSAASDSPRLRRISRSEADTDMAGEKASQIRSSYKRDTASRRN